METYIGIDLGGTSIKGGRIGPEGLERKEVLPVKKQACREEIYEDICLNISNLWSDQVKGIGFAVPALIEFKEGRIHGLSNIEQLNGFALKSSLEKYFQVPVLLQNDANCFVLGEKYFGTAGEYKNIVGIVLGTGVGTGLYLNDQIYEGMNCGAGEFGMIPYKDKLFENYCSGQFFIDNYKKSGELVAESASKNERWAIKAFKTFGRNVGELINHICYALDPEVIILGGSISISYELFKNTIIESLDSFYFRQGKRPKIMPSSMNNAGIYGAASLFMYYDKIKPNQKYQI